jgi:hypothetical protein
MYAEGSRPVEIIREKKHKFGMKIDNSLSGKLNA